MVNLYNLIFGKSWHRDFCKNIESIYGKDKRGIYWIEVSDITITDEDYIYKFVRRMKFTFLNKDLFNKLEQKTENCLFIHIYMFSVLNVL